MGVADVEIRLGSSAPNLRLMRVLMGMSRLLGASKRVTCQMRQGVVTIWAAARTKKCAGKG